ncbi:MAG: hypothetical protein Q7S13_04650 [Candidatus Omnitrophota bacterium]|nr:hypothetical protein [Candidatus Omnitrophota bacterium]
MPRQLYRIFLINLFLAVFLLNCVWACDICTVPRLGKEEGLKVESQDGKWFFKYLFEQQNWHEKEGGEGHALHDQGHHFHNKAREDFHHLVLGGNLGEALSVSAEIPYVIRHSIEVEDHDILGSKQKSEGLGDIFLIGQYALSKQEASKFNVVAGVKFPTGGTEEKNSAGTTFESELQPGSGSFDYLVGGIYKHTSGPWALTGNLAYVFKTEGDHDFEFGDLLSTSLFIDYTLNPQSDAWITTFGLDTNLQYEQKQEEAGDKVADSGGVTLLMGPALMIAANQRVSFFANVMLPVYQDLGGVHQELDYIWTAGGKIIW